MLITFLPTNLGANAKDIEIFNLSVSAKATTASLSWYTSQSVYGELKYGREDLGLRSKISTDKKTDWHKYNLMDLQPNAVYRFQAVAKNGSGEILVIKDGEFRTAGSGNQEVKIDFYLNFDNSLYCLLYTSPSPRD